MFPSQLWFVKLPDAMKINRSRKNAPGVECGEPSAVDVDLCGKSPHNFRLFKKGA